MKGNNRSTRTRRDRSATDPYSDTATELVNQTCAGRKSKTCLRSVA